MGYDRIARLSSDTEVTFGTIPGTWLDQRLVQGSVDMGASNVVGAPIPDPTVVSRLHEKIAHRVGSKTPSEIGFQLALEGLAAADVLDSAAAYVYPMANVSEVLNGIFGGTRGAAGSTVLGAGATVSIIPVQAGHGAARFPRGSIAGFQCTATSNVVECRQIAQQAVDNLHPHMQLSAAPADTYNVYNAEMFYLDPSSCGGSGDSLSIRILFEESGSQWKFAGCAGSLTVTMEYGGLLLGAFRLKVANPTKTSGDTLAGATYDGAGPVPVRIGEIQYANNSTSTAIARSLLAVESFGIDPGISVEAEHSLSGIETINRWRQMSQQGKATLRVRSHVAQDAFWTDYTARTTKQIGIQIGNTVGTGGTGVVYIFLPRVQFAREPQRVEDAGFELTDLEFDLMENAAGGTTALEVSPIVIGLL